MFYNKSIGMNISNNYVIIFVSSVSLSYQGYYFSKHQYSVQYYQQEYKVYSYILFKK